MAWEGSTRKATLPVDWPKLRQDVFDRDGHRCTYMRSDGRRCSTRDRLECDHVGDRLNHDPSNLTTLCSWHHLRKSSSQGGQAAAAAKAERPSLARRKPERHPGLL